MYKIQEIQNVGIDISVSVSMSVNWNITEQILYKPYQTSVYYHPVDIKRTAAEGGLIKCCYFLFSLIFNDFCQTYYLSIYRTYLHRICRDGRTMAVDERREVRFSIPQGTLRWQLFFVRCIHRIFLSRYIVEAA